MELKVPIPTPVQKMTPVRVPTGNRRGKLRLDFNENTIGCFPAALRAIRKLTGEQIAMYPDYEACVEQVARSYGVRPSEVTISNGAEGGLRQIVDTFVERGSTVLLLEPTFPLYRPYAEKTGARVISVRYPEDMSFPQQAVLSALRRSPRLVFIANPNNPTGTLAALDVLRKMIEASPRTLFVVDEAYYEFSAITVLPWIRRFPNLAVVRTFSKAAGLAGLRIGYVLACPEVTNLLARTRDTFPVNVVALAAVSAAMSGRRAVRAYVREIVRGRQFVSKTLTKMGVRVFPSLANFILVDMGPRAPRIVARLARQGILLRDRTDDFGRPGFVRITIGTMPQMKRLVRVFRAAL